MKTVLDIIEEDDASSAVPTDAETRSIAGWVSKVQQLDEAIAQVQRVLTSYEADRRHIATMDLPTALNGMGVERMDVAGLSLTLKRVVAANPTQADRPKMHDWMIANGHGDLIKRTITISFGRGEYDECEAVVKWLNDHAVQYNISEGVHHGTLNAWAKTMVENQEELPEFLKLYQGDECVIKERK